MRPADLLPWVVVTGAGTGRLPRAQGTAASLLAVLVVCALDRFAHLPWWWTAILAAGAAAANLLFAPWIARRIPGKDPGAVVIDEFAGQWLALSIPWRGDDWMFSYLLPFVFFRLFDITKILGVRSLEKLPGAVGILCDDLLAGAYALALVLAARATFAG